MFAKHYRTMFRVLKARFPILKMIAPYLLQIQVFIVVVTVTFNNYIRGEAHKD